jgi:4-hydroxy-tetrahydrodipicolinate synthase
LHRRENRLLWDLMMAGDWNRAREVHRWYSDRPRLDVHTRLVQYIERALTEAGLGAAITCSPRLPVIGEERDTILAVIRGAVATRQVP